MAKIDFGGTVENVVTRDEFPLQKARQVLSDEVVAVLGYGVQGPAQALNMRDNGFNVILGLSSERPRSWNKATGKFVRHTISPPGAGVGTGMQIRVADLNGDGRPDIAVSGKSGTWVLMNEGMKR